MVMVMMIMMIVIMVTLWWWAIALNVSHVSCRWKTSNLIATEILLCDDVVTRVSAIEKWVAVADICRCLHNYNAVLEITSSLNRSSVFRLKKTWLKVSKQVGLYGGLHRDWCKMRVLHVSPCLKHISTERTSIM